MPQETKTMTAVFLTVLFGFAGFSLPYPVFSPMFLKPELGFLDPSVPTEYRTMLLGVAMALYPIGQFIGAPWLGRVSDKLGRRPVLMASLLGDQEEEEQPPHPAQPARQVSPANPSYKPSIHANAASPSMRGF